MCSYNCAVLGEALAGPALKRAADEILPISRTSRHLSMFNQEYTKYACHLCTHTRLGCLNARLYKVSNVGRCRVYTRLMRQKLGLHAVDDVKVEQLVNDLLQVKVSKGNVSFSADPVENLHRTLYHQTPEAGQLHVLSVVQTGSISMKEPYEWKLYVLHLICEPFTLIYVSVHLHVMLSHAYALHLIHVHITGLK